MVPFLPWDSVDCRRTIMALCPSAAAAGVVDIWPPRAAFGVGQFGNPDGAVLFHGHVPRVICDVCAIDDA